MANYDILHLDPGEHVIMEVRWHWIVFIGTIIAFVFFSALPLFLYVVIYLFVPQLVHFMNQGIVIKSILIFYLFWLLSFWLSFAVTWTKYYLDVWYVTETRIIDVEQKRLFDREVSNLRFDRIQDITLEVQGIIATWLDFGNIRVQTAAEVAADFYLTYVSHPEEVKRVIFGQHNSVGDKGSVGTNTSGV